MHLAAENDSDRSATNGESVNNPMPGDNPSCRATVGDPRARCSVLWMEKGRVLHGESGHYIAELACLQISDLLDIVHTAVHNAGKMECGMRRCSQQVRHTTAWDFLSLFLIMSAIHPHAL